MTRSPAGVASSRRISDGERAADEEEERDRREVQQRDPLVIARQQPRLDAVAVVQVVMRRSDDGMLRAASTAATWLRLRSVRATSRTRSAASSCSSLTSP